MQKYRMKKCAKIDTKYEKYFSLAFQLDPQYMSKAHNCIF